MCESKRMVRDGQVERGEEAAKADVATHHAATAIQGFDGGSFPDRCVNAGEGPAPRGEGGPAAPTMIFPGPAPLRQCPSEIHGPLVQSHYQPAHTPPRSPAPDSLTRSYLAGRVQLPVGASSQLSAPIHPYTL